MNNSSKHSSFYHFIKTRPEPPLSRYGTKYYDEMQQLAYNLVRYLRMNDDFNEENKYQGNFNFTYLQENMTEEDFLFLVEKFMRSTPLGKLKEILKGFTEDAKKYLNQETKEERFKKMLIKKDKQILKLITEIDEEERTSMSLEEMREKLDEIYMIGK
jgi:type III secretory pathway component EscV